MKHKSPLHMTISSPSRTMTSSTLPRCSIKMLLHVLIGSLSLLVVGYLLLPITGILDPISNKPAKKYVHNTTTISPIPSTTVNPDGTFREMTHAERCALYPVYTEPFLMYLYRAHYDERMQSIRVLAVSRCSVDQTSIVMKSDIGTFNMYPQFIYESYVKCPVPYEAGYDYHDFELYSAPIGVDGPPKEITIVVNGTREVTMPVHLKPKQKAGTLQLCIMPLYFYSDWPYLIHYFEMWRKESPKIMIYMHSVSSNVLRVLRYYEKQGMVEIINWPKLPVIEGEVDPNKNIYRLLPILAQTDCASRSDAEFNLNIDIDELIYIKSGQSIVDYARNFSRHHADLGSLFFMHYAYNMPTLDDTFEQFSDAVIEPRIGPGKTLYIPSRVRYITTHWVTEHLGSFREYKADKADAVMLHARDSFKKFTEMYPNEKNDMKLPYDVDEMRTRCKSIAREIFKGEPPRYEPGQIKKAIKRCFAKQWNNRTRIGIADPVAPVFCDEELDPYEDWIHATETKDSRFLAI